jgi:hypothetical protein
MIFYNHPILTGEQYIVATVAIDNALIFMRNLVEKQIPGGIISGKPRYGKTWTCTYAHRTKLGGDFPIDFINYLYIATYHTRPNESLFWEELLATVGNDMLGGRKAADKRNRLIEYIVSQCKRDQVNRVVLIIDEAHKLLIQDYHWLSDLFNLLRQRNILLTTILVGQKELIAMRALFIASKYDQIVGRFMVHDMELHGIQDAEDLRICLKSYDEITPNEGGETFTQFFFPVQYSKGFRLEAYAKDLFLLFKEIRKESGLNSGQELPMQYVSQTVEGYYKTYGKYGAEAFLNFDRNANCWKEMIYQSGLVASEIAWKSKIGNAAS